MSKNLLKTIYSGLYFCYFADILLSAKVSSKYFFFFLNFVLVAFYLLAGIIFAFKS